MGQTSQSGQLIFATQSAFGVPVTPSNLGTKGLAVRVRSGTLAGNRDLLVTDPEIGAGRDRANAYLGSVAFAGDIEMYVRFRAAAFFLANALGTKSSVAVTASTGAHTHTITPADGQVPYMTVYEQIGASLERFITTDVVVNTLNFEADANGYLSMTAGLIGIKATPGAAAIDATSLLDNTSLAVGQNITAKYADTKLPAKSFSLSINNNFEDDNHYLGGAYLGDLTAKGREISASVNMRHTDAKAMRQSMFGTPTATEALGVPTKDKFEVMIESPEVISGVTGTPIKYSLKFEIPKAVYEPFSFAPSGDDAFENDVTLQAIRPDGAVPIMTATVVNGNAAIE
ncbi:major tail protein [Rhodococcus phage Reynauld]|uniref:Major tail protein n=1 Tax=Rhodococcus phage Reynauld TaxID=3062845 RepID=A0ACD4UHH9_9CAUD|nr:major tail protein [Rhodococcus phage Reynauld]